MAISLARWARLCELLALWAETQQRRSARLRKTFATGRRDCHLIAILIELACGQSPRQDSLVRGSQSPNNVPHACESGTRKTLNNQTHEPPRECADQECDSIDTMVARSISVNDPVQGARGEDDIRSKTAGRVLPCNGLFVFAFLQLCDSVDQTLLGEAH